MRPVYLIVGAIVLLPLGCQKVWGFEDFEEGTAGSGGVAGGSTGGAGGGTAGNGGAAGDAPCVDSGAPANMVGFRLKSGTCVWIDAHEVTVGDYNSFTATGSLFNQPPCQAKQTAEDYAAGCGADAATIPSEDQPVTCVDWCDAYGYCSAKGKILCPSAWDAPNDPNSWWYAACSSNGEFAYPGSDTADEVACNYSNNTTWGCSSTCTLAPPGTTSCKTPEGVFDMSGNVQEWVAGCSSTVDTAQCHVRGGSVQKTSSDSQCTAAQPVARSFRSEFTGFRCCWQP